MASFQFNILSYFTPQGTAKESRERKIEEILREVLGRSLGKKGK